MQKDKIGFIGQGWIGKHYADDFEKRGYQIVRYSKDPTHSENLILLRDCDYIFIAVPTPTTPDGFDYSIVKEVLDLVPAGRVAIIKSTLLPGTTNKLQQLFPNIYIVHSPEFLVEKTAAYDASFPKRNVIGLPDAHIRNLELARKILSLLPKANFETIVSATEAELIKYAGNCFLYTKVVYFNLIYDLAMANGLDYEAIKHAVVADPRIGESHTNPVAVDGGRGAGGHCFIKDFQVFKDFYMASVKDELGFTCLNSLIAKNNDLLKKTNKDLDILSGVYGQSVT